ncbi:MAG: AMP-binding protein [Verrucomicrobia bacterium]|nr:AMP-binding protein [Verrucomicrobiota bacterium]
MKSFKQFLLQARVESPDFAFLTLFEHQRQRVCSMAALVSRTVDYCSFYRRIGLRERDVVLIILRESSDLFASFFAGLVSGCLPAFCAYPSPKQSVASFRQVARHLLASNDVKAVIGFPEVIGVLKDEPSALGRDFFGCFAPEEVAGGDPEELERLPAPRREGFLQFSSGTTGARKGVLISLDALFHQLEAYAPCLEYGPSSKVVSWLPHYHDMGLIACMLMPFLLRVPIVMMSPFEWVKDPKLLLTAITACRGTHVWLPNFALGHLTKSVSNDELPDFDLRGIRQLICCSEPTLAETADRFVDKFQRAGFNPRALRNCYAMAENTFAMTTTTDGPLAFVEADPDSLRIGSRVRLAKGGKRIVSAGRPLPNLRLVILDDAGGEAPEGTVGEVAILSDCMLSEYHNNAEATREAFAGEWFKTGDAGFLRGGELYLVGRKKDILIVAGENIWPDDIESVLNEDPQLAPGRNVAFGLEDEQLGSERVVVLAETRSNPASVDTLSIRAKIVEALNLSVSDLVLLPHRTLLKSTAGKISRQLNKDAYLRGEFRRQPCSGSESALETSFLGRAVESPERPILATHSAASLVGLIRALAPNAQNLIVDEQSPLITSGLIDSFAFVELIQTLERSYGVTIPQALLTPDRFDTVACIQNTLKSLRDGAPANHPINSKEVTVLRTASRSRLRSAAAPNPAVIPWLERVINQVPPGAAFLYRWLFRLAGIRLGRNVTFLGKVHLKLRGRPENIVIEEGVVFGSDVDLRNREAGKIFLRQRVYLDDRVRLVAARDGLVELGVGTRVGAGTVINSGGITKVGEFCMLGGNVNINSSSHGIARHAFVMEQPYVHGFVEIGPDTWIGAAANILINTKIGEGCVIGANSVVSGEIPDFAVCAGIPAKVLKYR